MKLKYYLRGAGIGIIIAVLILVIGGSNNKSMSDGEIMRRAMELGMTKIDDSAKVKDYQSSSAAESSAAQESSSAAERASSSAAESSTAASSTMASSTTASSTTASSSASSSVSSSATSSTAATSQSTASSSASSGNYSYSTSGDTVTIMISTGMLSDKVADMLQSAGVIEDSKDFNKYLIANKYDTQILKGNVTVKKGASYAEIAKLLISKR